MMALSKDEFLTRWQQLHLDAYHMVNTDDKPSTEVIIDKTEKHADMLRNAVSHLQFAELTKITSPECYAHLLMDHLDTYGSLIDAPQAQNGLDNFAELVLAQTEGKRNESQQWKSSLSMDGIHDKSYVKKFLESCKTPENYVLPKPTKAAVPQSSRLPPPGAFSVNVQVQDPMHQSHPPRPTTQATQPRPLFRPHAPQNSLEYPRQTFESRQTVQSRPPSMFSGPRQGQGQGQNIQRETPEFNRGALFGGQSLSDSRSFWGMNKPVESEHEDGPDNRRSNILYPEQAPSRGPSASSHGNRRPQLMKRQWETGEEQDDNSSVTNSVFKTAKEQLIIEDQKKNRGVYSSGYGTNKKSLGTRRGLNSKFVPPVLNREEEESAYQGDSLARKLTSAVFGNKGSTSSGVGHSPDDKILDERFKNLDPKMVELIMNEIMERGPSITWDDIAGLEFAKKTIKEIVVWPMLRPDIFTGLRGPPKGLLLFGPPGTGKTLIGKCIASQSKSTFFSISASSVTSKWVGEGEKMVRALFGVARVHQPAVIFIDEIDSLLSKRSDTEHEGSRRIKTEFLVQLDGTTTGANERILVVGATNRPQEIDEAARRRFVKRLYIPLPEGVARKQIIVNLLAQQSNSLDTEKLEQICTQTDGYSGSDMANLCREAALGPIRSMPFGDIENITADQVRPIMFKDFQDALTQVRASVSQKDLEHYLDWNKQYGSWGVV